MLMHNYPKNRFLVCFPICIALTFIIASCTPGKNVSTTPNPTLAPELMDLSWKTKPACPYPCWYGLVVGESSKDDFLEVLPELSFLSGVEIHSKHYPIEFYDGKHHEIVIIPCEKHALRDCIIADFADDTLENIQLNLNYDLTIAEAIAEIGPPDNMCFSSPHPEMRFSQVYLKWVDRGFIMGHESNGNENSYKNEFKRMLKDGLIPGYLPIDVIYYYSKEELGNRCTGEWIGLKK
jgi:hypothetical protein